MPWIDADALKEKYADKLSVQRVFGYDAGFVAGIRACLLYTSIKISAEIIDWDGNREKHKKVVCPICFLPYFKEETDERTD